MRSNGSRHSFGSIFFSIICNYKDFILIPLFHRNRLIYIRLLLGKCTCTICYILFQLTLNSVAKQRISSFEQFFTCSSREGSFFCSPFIKSHFVIIRLFFIYKKVFSYDFSRISNQVKTREAMCFIIHLVWYFYKKSVCTINGTFLLLSFQKNSLVIIGLLSAKCTCTILYIFLANLKFRCGATDFITRLDRHFPACLYSKRVLLIFPFVRSCFCFYKIILHQWIVYQWVLFLNSFFISNSSSHKVMFI